MDAIRQDAVYASRVLLRRPGFTLTAVLTLALGIAANTTIFSLINAVLLRPLPYPAADRLLNLWASYPASNGAPDIFSPGNYADLAKQTRTLESAAAWTEATFTISGNGEPESIPGVRATASLGATLQVVPQLGRWFTPGEDVSLRDVALISDSLWRSRFGADRRVLGRTVQLNGRAFTIVGVLPPHTGFPNVLAQIYAPIGFTPDDLARRGAIEVSVVARLRPGVAIATARAELETIAAGLGAAFPDVNRGMHIGAEPLQQSAVANARTMLLVLWAAVAFMLAVACANVASLLLAHAAGRRSEFAL